MKDPDMIAMSNFLDSIGPFWTVVLLIGLMLLNIILIKWSIKSDRKDGIGIYFDEPGKDKKRKH